MNPTVQSFGKLPWLKPRVSLRLANTILSFEAVFKKLRVYVHAFSKKIPGKKFKPSLFTSLYSL